MRKRIYLAGPDVFFSKPLEQADALKKLCAQHDLEGVFPLDASLEFTEATPPELKGRLIFDVNVGLINGCHAVLANMMPFRSPSTDVGTAWEMGYAYARGLPVVGYSPDLRPYEQRVTRDEYMIESFNLVDNLMLACCVAACTNVEDAVAKLAEILK